MGACTSSEDEATASVVDAFGRSVAEILRGAEVKAGDAELAAPSSLAPDVQDTLASTWDAFSSSDEDGPQSAGDAMNVSLVTDVGAGAVGRVDVDTAAPAVPPQVLRISPNLQIGTEAWFRPLLQMTEQMRTSGSTARRLRVAMIQFGAGAPLAAMRLLGVPFDCEAADRRQASREFCGRAFGDSVTVCFSTGFELNSGVGWDSIAGAHRRIDPDRPDVTFTTLPNYTSSEGSHKVDDMGTSFEVAAEDVFAHLQHRKPYAICIDTDPSFEKADSPSHKNAMQQFLVKCRRLGYTMLQFQVPDSFFVEGLPNTTMFILGFASGDCGGDAVSDFEGVIRPLLMQVREHGPYAKMWETCKGGAGQSELPGLLTVAAPSELSWSGEDGVAPDLI